MKSFALATLLAGSAFAAPAAFEISARDAVPNAEIEARQIFGTGNTANELTSAFARCRPYIFIFARGSTETGNLGSSLGPPTCDGLKRAYGSTNVACQGVGGAYRASIGSNTLPEGTTSGSYNEAIDLFELANSKCPDSIVVAGGYSQGAAVMTAAIRRLDDDVQDQIAGVVLYGNTRNAQEGGKIPNFPPENVLTICARTDGVCGGALIVNAGHLSYSDDVPDAVRYLQGRISAAQ